MYPPLARSQRRQAIANSRNRPRRPAATGSIENFHHTVADGWGYDRYCGAEAEPP